MITWMILWTGKTLEMKEEAMWKRLWVCRKTDCGRGFGCAVRQTVEEALGVP